MARCEFRPDWKGEPCGNPAVHWELGWSRWLCPLHAALSWPDGGRRIVVRSEAERLGMRGHGDYMEEPFAPEDALVKPSGDGGV